VAFRLVIVGGGKMGDALLSGLLAGDWCAPGDVAVVEAYEPRRDELAGLRPGVHVSDVVPPADGAVIAVKPADVATACRAIADAGVARVLSIAAGVRIGQLESWLAPKTAVIRAMPNTPALIGAGAAAIAPGSAASEDDLAWAEGILRAVGVVERVDEPLLDAVTGLSGSGPAYVFLLAEALIEAGVHAGLPRPTSRALVVQTLLGSARLLAESGDDPEQLRAAVTSPGGTTAAGLRVLEGRAVRGAIVEAVLAAAERSRELGS
jgi:pyrroline-5-carboxylate reductase